MKKKSILDESLSSYPFLKLIDGGDSDQYRHYDFSHFIKNFTTFLNSIDDLEQKKALIEKVSSQILEKYQENKGSLSDIHPDEMKILIHLRDHYLNVLFEQDADTISSTLKNPINLIRLYFPIETLSSFLNDKTTSELKKMFKALINLDNNVIQLKLKLLLSVLIQKEKTLEDKITCIKELLDMENITLKLNLLTDTHEALTREQKHRGAPLSDLNMVAVEASFIELFDQELQKQDVFLYTDGLNNNNISTIHEAEIFDDQANLLDFLKNQNLPDDSEIQLKSAQLKTNIGYQLLIFWLELEQRRLSKNSPLQHNLTELLHFFSKTQLDDTDINKIKTHLQRCKRSWPTILDQAVNLDLILTPTILSTDQRTKFASQVKGVDSEIMIKKP